jgi:undecaprenyl-diphosphatase
LNGAMTERRRSTAAHWRLTLAIVLLAVLWFAMLTLGMGPVDDWLLSNLYAGGKPALVTVARGFTFLGEPVVLIGLSLVVAAWLAYQRRGRYALALVVVTLVGRGLAEIQKYAIDRIRPENEVHLVPVSTPSFPSGHATSSMIVYLTLAIVLAADTRWKWPAVAGALALSFCIGVSRLMLGVHWPTDVVGGWAFGLLWVLLALPRAERLAKRP